MLLYLVLFQADVSSDSLVWLFNLGTAGVWLVAYMTGLVHGKPEVDYLKKQLEERDRLIEAMRVQVTDRTLPALVRVGQVMSEYPPALKGDAELTQTLEGLIGRVERVLGNEPTQ